ncbi:P-loop containing nucleoside triphosphate hydrolase protein [Phlyctochytrium arcticum]|nr:P-loop containing nucleoside triphosphate hydrolase protein [Phlyctochytrium arcticum]
MIEKTTLASIVSQQTLKWYEGHRTQNASRPLIVGISGPQGIGKTTLVQAVSLLLTRSGLKVTSFSMDDFYFPYAKLCEIAKTFPGNPLLEFRGNPGTQDIALEIDVLDVLAAINEDGNNVRIPVFDKSAHNGRGDRVDPEHWTVVKPTLDIVLIDGWCLGFTVPSAHIVDEIFSPNYVPNPMLETACRQLKKVGRPAIDQVLENLRLHQAATSRIDKIVQILPKDISFVYQWRLQQEHSMKAKNGGKGMSDKEISAFVDRFMPLYAVCLPQMISQQINHENILRVFLDEHRHVIS